MINPYIINTFAKFKIGFNSTNPNTIYCICKKVNSQYMDSNIG